MKRLKESVQGVSMFSEETLNSLQQAEILGGTDDVNMNCTSCTNSKCTNTCSNTSCTDDSCSEVNSAEKCGTNSIIICVPNKSCSIKP